ncbi:hypothetical protein ACFSC4_26950 [Deinococcus malanensis]|uniref:hypothetical protein n=1 Tax=Deinococcus malanensis TaxID=1706855 RepID=UPI0036428087
MTRTLPRNDHLTPIEPGPVTPSAAPMDIYEELCHRARALEHDAAFLALLRRPGLDSRGAVRLALDAVPDLELLPLPVLVQELGAVLGRARPGSAPRRRACGWHDGPPVLPDHRRAHGNIGGSGAHRSARLPEGRGGVGGEHPGQAARQVPESRGAVLLALSPRMAHSPS